MPSYFRLVTVAVLLISLQLIFYYQNHGEDHLLCNGSSEQSSCITSERRRSINETSFVASAINRTFVVAPNNTEIIYKMGALSVKGVKYLRNTKEIKARGLQGSCTNVVDVLGWIMDEVNKENMTMMIAYGELIHLYREGDFVKKGTGRYIDDDFDTFASLSTVSLLGTLEPELFERFGWTIRVFLHPQEYVVFIQIMASCGHTPVESPKKVISSEPAIEVYPLARSKPIGGRSVVKDLWQGTIYSESIIFPSQHFGFDSAATNRTLNLQVPNKVFELLTCLYGNWMVPSSKHARLGDKCMDR